MKQTYNQLIISYYIVYFAAVAAAASGFSILKSGFRIDPLSETGIALNSILILFILGSVPATLAVFNKLTKKWIETDDEQTRLKKYKIAGTIRILILGLALIPGILFFYIMNSQSMLFCAGIALIALFFCKPTKAKITRELNLDETLK